MKNKNINAKKTKNSPINQKQNDYETNCNNYLKQEAIAAIISEH